MVKNAVPEFKTRRLFLRGIRLSDAESYQKHFADWEIINTLNHKIPWPYPEKGAEDYIKTILPKQGVSHWTWGLFSRDNLRELIGCCELRRKGTPGNRGFWLARRYWGKGLMTEAQYPILNYAFQELNFKKLLLDNAVQNTASRRIKEKTACRFIEIRPQKFVNPKFTESEIWELTKEDWLKFSAEKSDP